jgi:serine/threonine protein kinase
MLVIPEDPSIPPLVGEMPAGQTAHGTVAGQTAAAPKVNKTVAAIATTTMPPPAASTSAPTAVASAPAATLPPTSNRSFVDGVTVPPREAPPKNGIGLTGAPGDLPPPPREVVKETVHEPTAELSGTLGGYELVQKLGEGGMGAVYLARQVSLDRNVALKVLNPQLAEDPQFVARFTREAYAAAQLSHHNVVQIHDIGVDKDTNFFSMEYVPGQTLEKVVKHDGKLDPDVAVGYVLQAARGLRFAHDHGLIHRDVKPDNLLLNEQGIVKVADLGLVKQAGKQDLTVNAAKAAAPAGAGADKTQLNISMGTPAYMPPEQARDAAHVDQRADIYSLGCTLYDLLTGRPPFAGKTAVEVITKHQKEPIVPPDRVARHVSPELSQVVMKMMGKRPEERYQSMAEVVEALESILGIESGKAFSPKEEHVRVLEGAVEQFNGSKWAGLRRNLIYTFFGVCAAGAILCAIPSIGKPTVTGAFVGFAVLTTLFYQLLVGVTQKTHVFTRVRQYAFGARLVDWLKFLAAFAILVLLLIAFKQHWNWLGAAVVAAGTAAAFHFTVDKLVVADRKTPVGHVEAMLKKMRLRGLDETALRQFVCKYSGERWEEMYETLFGYEAKRMARRSWGKSERGRDRKKFGAWRDWIVDSIDARMVARREERERKMLQKIEAKALQASGVDINIANRKARDAAAKMVDKAARVKASADRRMMMTALPMTTSGRKVMFADAKPLASWADGFEEPEDDGTGKRRGRDVEREHESYFKRRFGTPMDFVLGPAPRVLVGAMLVALFALWVQQNGGIEYSNTANFNPQDIVEGKVKQISNEIKNKVDIRVKGKKQLQLPMVPDWICSITGSNYNGGVAGAILLLTAFFAGKRLGVMVWLGAVIALFAYRYNVPLLFDRPWIAAGIGAGVAVLGIFFFRKTAADS